MKRLQHGAALVLAMLVVPGMACAQNFPTRTIRILTVQAGGSSDLPARIIAKDFQASPGHPAAVENRGIIGVGIVAQAPPDGHTLVHDTSPLWIIPRFRSASWDAAPDFVPITITIATPNVLVVHPSAPAAGLPGYESISYTAFFAPAKTPAAIVNRLSQEAASALRVPEVKERLFKTGVEVVANTPQEAAAMITSETERVRKMIAAAGLREQ